jgi:tetratricopeptide (TPR) repeat protein
MTMPHKFFIRMRLICTAAILALWLGGCISTPAEQRIDNEPMYGQPTIPRPEFLKRADQDFITQATAGFATRAAASKAWAAQALEYLNKGNMDYAMRRYNQSWLLDPDNYQPYWGFGRVLLERNRVDDALEYFAKAKQLLQDTYQMPALLADTATAYSVKAYKTPVSQGEDRAHYFDLATQHFLQSTLADPSYANAYRSWARALYFEGRYTDAWEKVKKARTLGAAPFPQEFLNALKGKMPEPY